MKEYLAIFSIVGLTIGIGVFTAIFVRGMGMSYQNYRAWLSILLSFISLISSAAMSYYFAKKHHPLDASAVKNQTVNQAENPQR